MALAFFGRDPACSARELVGGGYDPSRAINDRIYTRVFKKLTTTDEFATITDRGCPFLNQGASSLVRNLLVILVARRILKTHDHSREGLSCGV